MKLSFFMVDLSRALQNNFGEAARGDGIIKHFKYFYSRRDSPRSAFPS